MANLSSKTGFTPLLTQVPLANNGNTTVQNMSAYDGQILTGFVYVDATTDYRVTVIVQVVKNGAGTYEVLADIFGDNLSGNPIVTFSMSGNDLIATLPNFTGFSSAFIKYKLDAPALGANFPLTVDSTNVAFTDIKASTAAGLNFKENGGTSNGSMADDGGWFFGQPGGGAAHTFVGRNGNPTSFSGSIVCDQTTLSNSLSFRLGSYNTGSFCWLQSLETGTANPKPFRFYTGSTNAGSYETDATWIIGDATQIGGSSYPGQKIVGRTNGGTIAAGYVGEYLSAIATCTHGSTTSTGSGTALNSLAQNTDYILQTSSTVPFKLTLTSGVWLLWMHTEFTDANKTSTSSGITLLQLGVDNNTTATAPTNFFRNSRRDLYGDSTSGTSATFSVMNRVNISSTTDYFIVWRHQQASAINASITGRLAALRVA
jgi:hypothetical protein